MFSVSTLSTSTSFAVNGDFIGEYVNIVNTGEFKTNVFSSAPVSGTIRRLYVTGSTFTYGEIGKSCRFATIGIDSDALLVLNPSSPSELKIVGGIPSSGQTNPLLTLQNDPSGQLYDLYYDSGISFPTYTFIVPSGETPSSSSFDYDRVDFTAGPTNRAFRYLDNAPISITFQPTIFVSSQNINGIVAQINALGFGSANFLAFLRTN